MRPPLTSCRDFTNPDFRRIQRTKLHSNLWLYFDCKTKSHPPAFLLVMAEAIGLAASLIAVIGVTTRIVGICKLCMESLEDCPKEFRMILVEISSTRALFDSLHFVQQHDPDSVDFLDKLLGPNGSITGCHAAIKELERLLPYVQSIYAQKITSREKAKIILKTLAWPLKQNKAKELLTRIAQHKTTINTAFSMEVWCVHSVRTAMIPKY